MMRKRILCAAMLAASGIASLGQSTSGQSAPQTAGTLTVIRAGTLIAGVSQTPRKNQLVFVRGERIEKETEAGAAIPEGAKGLDLSHPPLLPGLTDSHTHIFLWGGAAAKGGHDANILKAGI